MTKRSSKKLGRPPIPKAVRKAGTITVRVSDAQMRVLEGAARKAGTKLSTWARETLLAAAGAA